MEETYQRQYRKQEKIGERKRKFEETDNISKKGKGNMGENKKLEENQRKEQKMVDT